MKHTILAAAALALSLALGLTLGGEAEASGGDAIQLWFVTVQDDQRLFIGTMANEETCWMTASALARDRHAQGTGTRMAVFYCLPLAAEPH